MKRVGKRTRESAGGAKGLRCRAVVEEQAARRAGASDATGSIRTCEVRIPSNSVRCSVRTAWCRTASMHALALWASSHFALPLHCRARPIRISNLSTQTVAQQAMGCQYGVWMGAAKADEARRRVCVPRLSRRRVSHLRAPRRSWAPRQNDGHFSNAQQSLGNRLSADTRSLLGIVFVGWGVHFSTKW